MNRENLEELDNSKILMLIAVIIMLLAIIACFTISTFRYELGDVDSQVGSFAKEDEDIDYVGNVSFVVGEFEGVKLYDKIDFTEKEVKEIYREYARYDFTEVTDEVVYAEKYTITIDDITIVLRDGVSYGDVNDKYVDMGEFYTYLLDLVNNKLVSLNKVYLFDLESALDGAIRESYNLSDEEKTLINGYIQETYYDILATDINVVAKYLLLIDGTSVYFDSFNGYAMVNGQLGMLNNDLISILDKSINYVENGSN